MNAHAESDHVVKVGDVRIVDMGEDGYLYGGHGEECVVVDEKPGDYYQWLIRFDDGDEFWAQTHTVGAWRLVRRGSPLDMFAVDGYVVLLSGRLLDTVPPVEWMICDTLDDASEYARSERWRYRNVFIRPCGEML